MLSPKWPFIGYSCIKLITHKALHPLHILENRIKAEFFVNVFMSLTSYDKHHRLTYDLAVVSLCIALCWPFDTYNDIATKMKTFFNILT